jgi:Polysaccharide deacetylase
MPGNYRLTRKLLNTCGMPQLLTSVRSGLIRELRVLTYHRAFLQSDEPNFPFGVEPAGTTCGELDQRMANVPSGVRPLTCQQRVDAIRGRQSLPNRALLITFDDGYDDNYTVALPVLVKHGISGVFPLTTGYVSATVVPQHERRAHWALRAPIQRQRPNPLRVPMPWAEVRTIAAVGIERASHIASHPIRSTIPIERRFRTNRTITNAISNFRRPVVPPANPVGQHGTINPQVSTAVLQANFRVPIWRFKHYETPFFLEPRCI